MKDIVCSGCSLLCDDVAAENNDGLIRSLGLCRLGHAHLESALAHLDGQSIVREGGTERAVTLDEALGLAADILLEDGTPLLYGWSHTSNEVIREGLALAMDVNGYFDSIANLGAAQALRHGIHSLKLDTDLEYIRNHGELIIYWGSDPSESLHRHPSRFAVLPRGEKIPEGIESRTIAVVDVRQTETMKMANHRLIIPIGSDAKLLEAITAEISGESSISGDILGIPAAEVIGFSRGFQKSDCSVIFYGSGLLHSGKYQENLDALSKLIHAIRSTGKEAYALPMFPETNTMGVIEDVVASTSAPCSVDYSSGTGVHKSDETALVKLARGDFSSSLIVADDVLTMIPGPAAKALAGTKMVYIGPSGTISDKMASLSIHTAEQVLEEGLEMSRIDGVHVTLSGLSIPEEDRQGILQIISKLRKIIQERGTGK